jgi:hypothetical protein
MALLHIVLYYHTRYNQILTVVHVDLFYPSVSYTGTINRLAPNPRDLEQRASLLGSEGFLSMGRIRPTTLTAHVFQDLTAQSFYRTITLKIL